MCPWGRLDLPRYIHVVVISKESRCAGGRHPQIEVSHTVLSTKSLVFQLLTARLSHLLVATYEHPLNRCRCPTRWPCRCRHVVRPADGPPPPPMPTLGARDSSAGQACSATHACRSESSQCAAQRTMALILVTPPSQVLDQLERITCACPRRQSILAGWHGVRLRSPRPALPR